MNLILIRFLILRIKTNQKPARFSSVRVGAYCIRLTDDHGSGRMNLIPIRFLIHRIKTNQKPARFSSVRVGAYCIRPTNGHTGGRMERKIAIFQVARLWGVLHTPHKRLRRWSNGKKNRHFFGYPCRGVLHTPYKRPRQRPNEINSDPIFDSPNKNEHQPRRVFHSPNET